MPRYHPAEMMIVEMARRLRDGDRVMHGVASPLPLIAIQLAMRTFAPNLVYLNLPGGVGVRVESPPVSTAHPSLAGDTLALFPLQDLFDLAARGGLDVAFLSGVQVDARGNLNMTAIGPFDRPRVRLPGGAGSAFLISNAKRTVLWKVEHSPRGLVEQCDFVTAANSGSVQCLITPLATFEMAGGRLRLATIHPHADLGEVRSRTGFPLPKGVPPSTPPPSEEELALIREIDTTGRRFLEFGGPPL